MKNHKLHLIALGCAVGTIEGLCILGTTLVLLARGDLGETFLGKFLPFYSISWLGALLGLIAGFIDGFIGGVLLAWVYNFIVARIRIDRETTAQ